MVTQEKRTEMVGCHLTPREKKFLRAHLGKMQTYTSSSNFIRNILTDVLAKVEDPENPFYIANNNQ